MRGVNVDWLKFPFADWMIQQLVTSAAILQDMRHFHSEVSCPMTLTFDIVNYKKRHTNYSCLEKCLRDFLKKIHEPIQNA